MDDRSIFFATIRWLLIEATHAIQLLLNFSLGLCEFPRLILFYLYLFVMLTLT